MEIKSSNYQSQKLSSTWKSLNLAQLGAWRLSYSHTRASIMRIFDIETCFRLEENFFPLKATTRQLHKWERVDVTSSALETRANRDDWAWNKHCIRHRIQSIGSSQWDTKYPGNRVLCCVWDFVSSSELFSRKSSFTLPHPSPAIKIYPNHFRIKSYETLPFHPATAPPLIQPANDIHKK